MSYEGMVVIDGEQAGLAWEKMTTEDISVRERKQLYDGLLAYCRQDTLAMAELLGFVRSMVDGTKLY